MITAQEQAFISPPLSVGGLELRPLTAGTLIILKQTGNKLVDGIVDGADREFQVAAFLFIHAADPKRVRRVSGDPASFRDAVLEFADGLSITNFAEAAVGIRTICEQATVGQVYEVEDKGGGSVSPNA